MKQQDPVYQRPGVALDRGVYEAYATAWGRVKEALEFLLREPATMIPRETRGRMVHATAEQTSSPCNIGVLYASDWDDSCWYTYADVALAAYAAVDKCSPDASKVGPGLAAFGSGGCKAYAEVAGSL
ncbi:hypothetical protein BDW74DRAFT_182574 [Aspergillus multicolor]|uniref:uncharacterized protein n=1 Tax=Aspergillus multicolor TaxID=41759 RepID=UPI003CCDD9C6